MKVTKLNESKSDIHLYYDEFSGKTYIFDGKKLKEIDKSPDQNNRPTDEDEEARQQEHDRQQEAEKNEAGEGTKQRLEDPFENETEEERAERIKKTQDMFKNPDILKDLESEEEYTKNAEARSERIKSSNKKEIKKFDGNLATFKTDLEKLIASQIKRVKQLTWKASDPRFEGTGMFRRGKLRRDSIKKPLLIVYIDQSGSWGDSDIRKAMNAVSGLREFEKKGLLKLEVKYFADYVSTSSSISGSTRALPEILKDIRAEQQYNPLINVAVFTDGDFDSQCTFEGQLRISGGVWFIFRDGIKSKLLLRSLSGKQATRMYTTGELE
jgi:hypothetical protein|nr:MAG TPA: Protein of unknown function (DUF444) [Caudoviricetes sp.]